MNDGGSMRDEGPGDHGSRPWSARRLGAALLEQKRRLDAERRARYAAFGVDPGCAWPASRVFHRDSALGPAWQPILTADEVEALTLDGDYARYPQAPVVALPPALTLDAPLDVVIRERATGRDYEDAPIDLARLATLLDLGAGVVAEGSPRRRAAPSPGALYPVELYPIVFAVEGLAPALYHFRSVDGVLETLRPVTGRAELAAFLPTHFARGHLAALIAITVRFARVQAKYLERGYRFALLEAGHIAQNMLLAGAATGLACAPLGGFWDEPFNEFLSLDSLEEAVVYAIALGFPAITENNADRG